MDLSALRNDVLAEIGGNVATFLGHGAITTLGYLLKRPMGCYFKVYVCLSWSKSS